MNKLLRLEAFFAELGTVAVAFSGGVDSTLLTVVAARVLKEKALAITVHSPYIPDWEVHEAKELAKAQGVVHHILELAVPDTVLDNPADRCYLCKREVFSNILRHAHKHGFNTVADGTNADDSKDYRPGLRALAELGIKSPLQQLGITKEDVRSLSRELGLPTWNKPPYACLLTRLPYGTRLQEGDFRQIEAAEVFMMQLGFRAVRVRKFGDLAKIEVDRESLPTLLHMELFDCIATAFRELGFSHVTLDMSGYRTGSMNDQLKLGEVAKVN